MIGVAPVAGELMDDAGLADRDAVALVLLVRITAAGIGRSGHIGLGCEIPVNARPGPLQRAHEARRFLHRGGDIGNICGGQQQAGMGSQAILRPAADRQGRQGRNDKGPAHYGAPISPTIGSGVPANRLFPIRVIGSPTVCVTRIGRLSMNSLS